MYPFCILYSLKKRTLIIDYVKLQDSSMNCLKINTEVERIIIKPNDNCNLILCAQQYEDHLHDQQTTNKYYYVIMDASQRKGGNLIKIQYFRFFDLLAPKLINK